MTHRDADVRPCFEQRYEDVGCERGRRLRVSAETTLHVLVQHAPNLRVESSGTGTDRGWTTQIQNGRHPMGTHHLGKHKYSPSSYSYTCRSAVTFCSSIIMVRHSNSVHWYLEQQHFNSYLGEAAVRTRTLGKQPFVLVPWGSSRSPAVDSAPSRQSSSGRRRRCR